MIFINVDNVSAKELNDYMYDAVKNNTWETTSNNKDYYTIKVLIGNTSDSGFNDAYNKNLVKKFFGGKKVSDKVDFILGVCDINNCTYDTMDTLYLIKFDLQMADSNGNVYLIAKNARVSTYQNLKNNKIGYYVSHDISGEKKDQISLNFDNKSDNNSDSNSENKNPKGSADNPFIINGSGTINVYNKDNEYWKSSDKIYFKVNMPNNVVYKSSGRFTIKVDGKSMGENEWLCLVMWKKMF